MADHVVEISDEVSSGSNSSERRRSGVCDAKYRDPWGNVQHGSFLSQDDSPSDEQQSWSGTPHEKQGINNTAYWVDSISEGNVEGYPGYYERKNNPVIPFQGHTEPGEKNSWNDGEKCGVTEIRSREFPQCNWDHMQGSKDSNLKESDQWKTGKVRTNTSRPYVPMDGSNRKQERPQDLQGFAKSGADGASSHLPIDNITNEWPYSRENVPSNIWGLGRQSVMEPPKWLPGAWPRTSPVSPPDHRQNLGLLLKPEADHQSTSWTVQQTEDTPISNSTERAALKSSPAEPCLDSSHLRSRPEPTTGHDSLVQAPADTYTAYNKNTAGFRTDRNYHVPKEPKSRLILSGVEKPMFEFRNGISALYARAEEVAWRRNVSHQIQSGQQAAYSHKMATPKYMDSHEKPYAVFVFHYRSQCESLDILCAA